MKPFMIHLHFCWNFPIPDETRKNVKKMLVGESFGGVIVVHLQLWNLFKKVLENVMC